jgi:hypothetical protein
MTILQAHESLRRLLKVFIMKITCPVAYYHYSYTAITFVDVNEETGIVTNGGIKYVFI